MAQYIVRSRKQFAALPGQDWVNTYEIDTADPLTSPAAQSVMLGIRDAERQVQLSNVQLFDVTMSTYEADSKPYNPFNLYTLNAPIVNGLRATSGDEESIDTVLYVIKVPTHGKKGKNFYRGALNDSEVIAEYGRKRLTGTAITALTTAIGEMFLGIQETLLTATAGLVMMGESTSIKYPATPEDVKQIPYRVATGTTIIRTVVGMNLGGVSTLDADFGYYNRRQQA